MTRPRTHRAVQHRRKKIKRRMATTILVAATALAIIAGTTGEEQAAQTSAMQEEIQPFYMTEEYARMKQEEQRQAEEEAQALQASIQEYQRKQEKEAQRLFEEAQCSMDVVPAEDEEETDGFIFYEIPEEYQKSGSFPEAIQRHLYRECKKNGVPYPIGIGLIEQESGYQPDIIGEDGDSGYTQWIPRYQKETMEELGIIDPTDPEDNITIGMAQLGALLEKYDGNEAKALTAYNCGPTGAYQNYFSAGQDASPYAKQVLERAARIEAELAAGA